MVIISRNRLLATSGIPGIRNNELRLEQIYRACAENQWIKICVCYTISSWFCALFFGSCVGDFDARTTPVAKQLFLDSLGHVRFQEQGSHRFGTAGNRQLG